MKQFPPIEKLVVTLDRSGKTQIRRTDHDITIPSCLSQSGV
jgi:hypothetical protein